MQVDKLLKSSESARPIWARDENMHLQRLLVLFLRLLYRAIFALNVAARYYNGESKTRLIF